MDVSRAPAAYASCALWRGAKRKRRAHCAARSGIWPTDALLPLDGFAERVQVRASVHNAGSDGRRRTRVASGERLRHNGAWRLKEREIMDDRRFDALARRLGSANTRRQVLGGLLGIGSATVATSFGEAEAARRPAPAPKPVSCPGQQIPIDGMCACPPGTEKCGPDCCPAGAQCCENACCYGTCYGEELCCPTGNIVCDGVCRDWECCADGDCPENWVCESDTHACQCVSDCTGKTCGSNGCDGSCGTCPDGQTCKDGACVCTTGVRCTDDVCHECCSHEDCPEHEGCDAETLTCQCVADCTGKTCGDNGCGGSCGTCPDGQTCRNGICTCTTGFLCSDNVCRGCCSATDCAEARGGDAECWSCSNGTCGYYAGFCTGGVCGVSTPEVIGHCVECGKAGVSTDACNASFPCCAGFTCDFMYGDWGQCRAV